MSQYKNRYFEKLAAKKRSSLGKSKRTELAMKQDVAWVIFRAEGSDLNATAKNIGMAAATLERFLNADANKEYQGYQPRMHTGEKIMDYAHLSLTITPG